MKKSIATLLVAILALGSVSAYALTVSDSATAIKKIATAAIKNGDGSEEMTELTDLLSKIGTATEKQKAVISVASQRSNWMTSRWMR